MRWVCHEESWKHRAYERTIGTAQIFCYDLAAGVAMACRSVYVQSIMAPRIGMGPSKPRSPPGPAHEMLLDPPNNLPISRDFYTAMS